MKTDCVFKWWPHAVIVGSETCMSCGRRASEHDLSLMGSRRARKARELAVSSDARFTPTDEGKAIGSAICDLVDSTVRSEEPTPTPKTTELE